jgi:hypothetical protein
VDRVTLRDRLSGAVLLTLAIIYFVAARGLPQGQDEPGPAFFPMMLAVALGLVSLVIVVRPERTTIDLPPLNPSLLVIVATIAYIVAFAELGYWASTLSYTFAMVAVSSKRRDWRWLTIPLVTSVLVYGLFGLGLRLPLTLP